MVTSIMPAAFVGHGSPMNALEHNRYTEAWAAFGASVGSPRAILAISAHWYINASAVTAMERPRTIHDFYGFPQELFAVRYPAPGDRVVADEIVEVCQPKWVGLDEDSWGIDHGTWSVLVHAFPDANVPVLQLSINALEPIEYHVDMGARLAPLRERGVLILASGNVVHNLSRIDPAQETTGFDWARRFDEAARAVMSGSPEGIVALEASPDYRLAVPTAEHFLPLAYLAGLASAAGSTTDVLIDGYAFGSLSMTSFTLGAGQPGPVDQSSASTSLPPGIPPEDMNL
jgi:4,5-DOPA dioxygenase extradiol